MDESVIQEKFISFGLTRQEASIYLCLFKYGELTGYEVAKQTGISRILACPFYIDLVNALKCLILQALRAFLILENLS